HHARFFRCLGSFAGHGVDGIVRLFAGVIILGFAKQLLRIIEWGRSVLVGVGCLRNADRIARFEQAERGLLVHPVNRLVYRLDVGGVHVVVDDLVVCIYFTSEALGVFPGNVFGDDKVAGLRDRIIRFSA